MRRGGEVVQVVRQSRRSRLRAGHVAIAVLALGLGGACSDDDSANDASTASLTTSADPASDTGGSVDAPEGVGSTTPGAGATGNGGSVPNATNVECVDDVAVVDMDDGTVVVEPEATFERTWVIENTGECTWSSEYAWSFTGGDALTIESVTPVGSVPPGETAEITVTLHAPADLGRYAGQFQLVAPGTMEPLGQAVPYTVEVAR